MTKLSPINEHVDRKSPPDFNKDFKFSLREPEVIQTSTGSTVYIVAGGKQRILKVDLAFRAGRWFERRTGESHFTASMLSKGTTSKDSYSIAMGFEKLGAHLEVSPGQDFVIVSLYSLTSKFPEAMNLLVEVLTEPSFDKREFDVMRSIFLESLKINMEKTSFVSSRTFRKTLYGDHPYGYEIEETSVAELDSNALSHFYESFTDFTTFVSGAVDSTNLKILIDSLNKLKYSPAAEVSRRIAESSENRIYQPKESSIQSSIRIGMRTIQRAHEDYPLLLLANHVLGGFFGSRLMKNIREEKGLTYGIHSSIHSLVHDAYFVIGTDVNKDNREVAIEEIAKELDHLRRDPIPKDELDTARYHFLGSLSSDLNTPFAHSDKIRSIVLNKLESDYYSGLFESIRHASADDLLRAVGEHLTANKMTYVSVG